MIHPTTVAHLGLAILAALLSPGLLAASILVNTTEDEFNSDGDCSLREAVLSANSNTFFDNCNAGTAGSDSVIVLVSGTIELDDTLPVSEALSVIGPGQDTLTIVAASGGRHFDVAMPDNSHDFEISALTLRGGRASADGGGAILATQVGTLTLDDVRLIDNRADAAADLRGGAVALILPEANGSRLNIRDSLLEDNAASGDGGAVHAGLGAVTEVDIQRSVFRGNTADDSGGAIYARPITFTIADSLFENNRTDLTVAQANDFGGAIHWFETAPNALLLIERSTFAGNASRAGGGALFTRGTVTVVRNSTFTGNRSVDDPGDAIDFLGQTALMLFSTLVNNGEGAGDAAIRLRETGDLTLSHNIIWADWQPTADCVILAGSTLTSNGFNIDSSGTCTGQPTDRPSTDPQLGPLADNGDSVAGIILPTHLPQAGSAAVDGGSNSCPGLFGGSTSEDQRGRERPVPAPDASTPFCDIGAVEVQPDDRPTIFADRFEAGS